MTKLEQTEHTQKLAAAAEKLLAESTRPLRWAEIYEKTGIKVEDPFYEMRVALKYLVERRRIRIITPPYNNIIHYQHVIDDKNYKWPKPEPEPEPEYPCPGIYPCPFADDGLRCVNCPVLNKEVSMWWEMPCPKCGTKLVKLGTTKIHYCPNCGFDNRAAFEEETE